MSKLSPDEDDPNIPKGYSDLFLGADISEACEGLVVLLHAFMLEVGYIPKDVDEADIYKSMPKNWRVGGAFNILYSHKSIPEVFCRVDYVPLYSNLIIHGMLEDNEDEDRTEHFKVKVNTEGDVSDPWRQLPSFHELSLKFKDKFCFPLLVLLQERTNYKPSFGLSGLINEAKFIILTFLPVESVLSMSAVNKDFHNQVNSSYLWKCLFSRDYGADLFCSGSSSNEVNWKEMYKKEYLKRKRWHRAKRPRFLPCHTPEIFPIRPEFDNNIDLRIDMDPALQQAFPLMRNRFRPSYWWPQRENSPFNPWFF